METFSLLLASLDQQIDRKSLEDASDAARSIARADCVRLHRELSGIFISGLSRDEAVAFQTDLAKRGFSTHLVADRELPALYASFQIQRIEQREEVLVLTDSMGRERIRPLTDLVFLAAGFVNRIDFKTEWHQHLDFGSSRGGGMPKLMNEREFIEETDTVFRLDFFFWAEPNRLHVLLDNQNALFHQGKPVRMKNEAGLQCMVAAMAGLMPPERMNSFLRDPAGGRVYSNLAAYENEIRWHFHRIAETG